MNALTLICFVMCAIIIISHIVGPYQPGCSGTPPVSDGWEIIVPQPPHHSALFFTVISRSSNVLYVGQDGGEDKRREEEKNLFFTPSLLT